MTLTWLLVMRSTNNQHWKRSEYPWAHQRYLQANLPGSLVSCAQRPSKSLEENVEKLGMTWNDCSIWRSIRSMLPDSKAEKRRDVLTSQPTLHVLIICLWRLFDFLDSFQGYTDDIPVCGGLDTKKLVPRHSTHHSPHQQQREVVEMLKGVDHYLVPRARGRSWKITPVSRCL